MIPDERRRRLLHLVEERGSVSVADLTDHLGVSHMTVRRDIRLLEESGRLRSVAGGVSLPSRLELDAPHHAKIGMRPDEKDAIARAAVRLVAPADLVYLDAGTTTLAIAHHLAREATQSADRSFAPSVVTNDLAVAGAIAEHSSLRVQLLGGQVDNANLATHGATTAEELRRLNIDLAFVSTSSFDLRGISVPTEEKLVVKRAISESSRRLYLTTDSRKYGRVAAFKAIPFESFDGIITDSDFPESARDHARQLGVEVDCQSAAAP
ncbi:DeoR/GlpR family DNA-binding transcription regulator [Rothia koreensis]|jgi:DeoR/GlpR family transcriptional regulator of sugar metabolism|uniref:DeoR/GlpR family DNA-binding transcription regulator n=1 Tax=Rothia koreensis TaxID=592378 RepID=UPI0037CB1A79